MKCPQCFTKMTPTLTRKGVLVDICSSCRGVWLDAGEINFFVSSQIPNRKLKKYLRMGLKDLQKTQHKCSRCQQTMQKGRIPDFPSFQVEECSSCKGLYLDAHEFKRLRNNKVFKKIQVDKKIQHRDQNLTDSSVRPFFVKLPSMSFATWSVCGLLYGILFVILVVFMEATRLSYFIGYAIFISVVIFQFWVSPFVLDFLLTRMGSLNWVSLNELPDPFKQSLVQLCQKNRIPLPRMGIIRDGSPQAYTYGRTPYSARVIFSKGMFSILDHDELEAVLAHELGHIKHWDFVVMTVMKLVPLLLYTLYNSIQKTLESSKGKGGKEGLASLVLIVYFLYILSDYLVLFISRTREYYADRFSCFATKKPNSLLTALVKISYGLLSSPHLSKGHSADYQTNLESFNVMNFHQSKILNLVERSEFSPKSIENIMRWDLWNPWAFFYELRSTHPLTAKRIHAITSYATRLKQKPYLLFRKVKPESYWDDFFYDLFIILLPIIGGAISLLGISLYLFYSHPISSIQESFSYPMLMGGFVLGFCIGSLIKTAHAYPTYQFLSCSISALLKYVKVSPVRSVPVVLKGQIIGRGQAGNILSEDLFIRDSTGMMFLDHEPLGLNILFSLMNFKKFKNQNVVVKGWYRRSPHPHVEVKEISTKDHRSKVYTYNYKVGLACVGILIGLGCLLYF